MVVQGVFLMLSAVLLLMGGIESNIWTSPQLKIKINKLLAFMVNQEGASKKVREYWKGRQKTARDEDVTK